MEQRKQRTAGQQSECHSLLAIAPGLNPPPCPFASVKGHFVGEKKSIRQHIHCPCGQIVGERIVSGKEFVGWWEVRRECLAQNNVEAIIKVFVQDAVVAIEHIVTNIELCEENLIAVKKIISNM